MIGRTTQFHDLLVMIGLNERERDIYLHLLTRGPSFASTIAHIMDLPRSSVHYHLLALHERKIIHISKQKTHLLFHVIPPEHLFQSLENRYERIAIRMRKLREILKRFKVASQT